MADPRSFISGVFGKKAKSIAGSNGLQTMLNFCQAANPNNPAASRVSAGLKTLTGISKAIGKGGKLPVTVDNLSSNTKWVLGMVGIDSQALFKAGQATETYRDPVTGELKYKQKSIVDAAMGAAEGVFNKVKKGQFSINDIPIFGPPLEAAYKLQKTSQAEITAGVASSISQMDSMDYPSPWAVDLANRTHVPKFKFLFVVQFTFNAPYIGGDGSGDVGRTAAFVVRKSSRPGIKYEMQDVNYYNFRTKVVTKSEFEEMSMSFYDDSANSVATLHTAYVSAMSPIVNAFASELLEQQGMNSASYSNNTFNSNTSGGGASTPSVTQPGVANNSSSTGALVNNHKTVIKEITLYHVFDYGRLCNKYTFINPRITSFDLDDLDMTSSDITGIDLKFNYETVHTELALPISAVAGTLTTLTQQGRYPMNFEEVHSTKGGLTTYGTRTQGTAKSNCASNAMGLISDTIGSVKNYLGKLF